MGFGLSDTLKMLILRLWEVAPYNLNIFLTFQRGKKYLLAVALVMIMKEFTNRCVLEGHTLASVQFSVDISK